MNVVWNDGPFAGAKELLKEKEKRQIGVKKKKKNKITFSLRKRIKKIKGKTGSERTSVLNRYTDIFREKSRLQGHWNKNGAI